MKISQKQAALLAKEVFEKLQKQGVGKVSEATIDKLRKFKEKKKELDAKQREIRDEQNKHDATFGQIVGNIRGLYCSDNMDEIVRKLKDKNIPSISEIEDKIILKSMFANDTDMESFIQIIVKDFTKKKSVAVNSN